MPARDEAPRTFEVTSPDFRHGEPIPGRCTCDGEDRSPRLGWTGVPVETRSFALICDDPDAPRGTWQHWLLYNLPAQACELDAGVPPKPELPSGARQGINDFGNVGYDGPEPPVGHGVHHYHFRLAALDLERLDMPASAKAEDVWMRAQPHIIAEAEVVGVYER
jgi:Raf kinase inhibitor-like YbhB/YbcL family protein